jgi:hypothetical protein
VVLGAKDLSKKIVGLHAIAAQFFPEPVKPIVMISEPEADALAEAVTNVAQHYDLGAMFGGKYFAIGNLVLCAGMIYVPRMRALGQLSKAMHEQARTNATGIPPEMMAGAPVN